MSAPSIAIAMPIHWRRVGVSRSQIAGEERDDDRLRVDEHDRRGDGRQRDRRVPAPEVEREHARPRRRAIASLAAREARPLAPLAGERERDGDDDEREGRAASRDGDRMRVREPDEWPGERDAEQREPEDDERAPVRRRVASSPTPSARDRDDDGDRAADDLREIR